MASDQRPGASSKAEVANFSASKLSVSASAIFRAVEASLESRATTVAMGEGSGIARLSFVPSPDFTAEYPKPASANPQMVNNHFMDRNRLIFAAPPCHRLILN